MLSDFLPETPLQVQISVNFTPVTCRVGGQEIVLRKGEMSNDASLQKKMAALEDAGVF